MLLYIMLAEWWQAFSLTNLEKIDFFHTPTTLSRFFVIKKGHGQLWVSVCINFHIYRPLLSNLVCFIYLLLSLLSLQFTIIIYNFISHSRIIPLQASFIFMPNRLKTARRYLKARQDSVGNGKSNEIAEYGGAGRFSVQAETLSRPGHILWNCYWNGYNHITVTN